MNFHSIWMEPLVPEFKLAGGSIEQLVKGLRQLKLPYRHLDKTHCVRLLS